MAKLSGKLRILSTEVRVIIARVMSKRLGMKIVPEQIGFEQFGEAYIQFDVSGDDVELKK